MDIRALGTPQQSPSSDQETNGYLHSLRERVVGGRAERGPCPRFADLKRDLLPRVTALPGRELRAHHLELCLLCQTRVRNWRRRWSGKTDWGLAATGVAAHHLRVKGGSGLRTVGRVIGGASSWTAARARRAAEQRRESAERRRAEGAAGVNVRPEPVTTAPPPAAPAKKTSAGKKRKKKDKQKLPPLVVLEGIGGLPPETVLAEMVEARGGALVIVDSVDEIFTDRDFPSVHTIVLARPRPFGELPMIYETVRHQAPGRALFAIVAIPPTGSIARDLEGDSFVIPSPLTVESWASALETAGWQLPV